MREVDEVSYVIGINGKPFLRIRLSRRIDKSSLACLPLLKVILGRQSDISLVLNLARFLANHEHFYKVHISNAFPVKSWPNSNRCKYNMEKNASTFFDKQIYFEIFWQIKTRNARVKIVLYSTDPNMLKNAVG